MSEEMDSKAEEVNEAGDAAEAANAEAPAESGGEPIMCYVSKQMVPIEDTVEVDYGNNKKFRVLPKYVKY